MIMSTQIQYNAQAGLNQILLDAGASKTIYALVTPECEIAKNTILGNGDGGAPDTARAAFLDRYRDAWTGKQEAYHQAFFDRWHDWSAPLLRLDRRLFPYTYPTAGASEALRHLIYDYGNRARAENFMPEIHIFAGDYEGYRAYAEACHIKLVAHRRRDWQQAAHDLPPTALFCLSQPSAIDGNIWHDANAFLAALSARSEMPRVIMDMTYVGAIPAPPEEKFDLNCPAIRHVVFSLSKPFGVYYDRIGGVFCRETDLGLFGNMWFKNLMALQLGCVLMERHDVFDLPAKYRALQATQTLLTGTALQASLKPADVFLLATGLPAPGMEPAMADYLRRPPDDPEACLRVCLTPGMAKAIGTAGPHIADGLRP